MVIEAEDIKKRWQEELYTEELYKKDLHDLDNHDGVITHTHLEPDILEYEVKWALGSITMKKASGGPMSHPPFYSCLQSLPASGSFPMSWFFTSGGQSIGPSASSSVLPINIQD